jgi:hypothetical protein
VQPITVVLLENNVVVQQPGDHIIFTQANQGYDFFHQRRVFHPDMTLMHVLCNQIHDARLLPRLGFAVDSQR